MPRTARKPLNHIPAHRLSVRIFVCLQDRGDDYDEYGVCVAYVFVHPKGESLQSNGRVFTSGTIIKAGEQLPTQQILSFCQPIVKMVKGWRDTPILRVATGGMARSTL